MPQETTEVPATDPATTLLALITGEHRPGMTADLFDAMDGQILDVEQVVLRGRQVLAVLIAVPGPAAAAAARERISRAAAELGMESAFEAGGDEAVDHRRNRQQVTVLAAELRPAEIAGLARRIKSEGGAIDRIHRVASYPVTALRMEVSGPRTEDLRRALAQEAAELSLDVAVQSLDLDTHGQRLVVMDVDSTLIQDEVIELIADYAGVAREVADVTGRAMAGELDFGQSLQHRVALLAGVPVEDLDRVRARVRLTPGARTLCRTLKRLGYRIALVSGGFMEVVEELGRDLDVDFVRANRLEVRDGRLTGRTVGPVVDRAAKAAALREFAAASGIPMSRTIAIGDGANDLDMLAAAGLGIAFNAKPVVRNAADAALNVPFLDSVLYILGISREDVEAADLP